MRDKYDFTTGARGKYAEEASRGTNVVLLDPDVASVFQDPKVVNAILRSLLPVVTKRTDPR
jgi:hypothetical protein